MRLKKGFTLAEILIVLMVIGVIATMTIPSMMKGVTEAQLKTGYKKAYNTISNFAAMERVSGTLPARATEANINSLYTALNNSLSVKGYASDGMNSGSVNPTGSGVKCIKLSDGSILGTNEGTCADVAASSVDSGSIGADTTTAWIVTEDNIAYAVVQGGAKNVNASTKQQIAAMDTDADATEASSAVIYVDVNGITKGPNTFEVQGISKELDLTNYSPLDTITGDRFKIYIGIDGATAGPREGTATGRMAADIK